MDSMIKAIELVLRSKTFRLLMPGIVLIISSASITTLYRNLLIVDKSFTSFQTEYFSYLSTGIDSGRIDEEYCKISFNHFDRKTKGAFTKYGFIELLEDFIVYYSSTDSESDSAKLEGFNSVIDILKNAKESDPFAALPLEEKRLMDNIQALLQKGDVDNSLSILNQLKQVILARQSEYNRIEKQNSWSIPIAIVGAVLTLFFGILSAIRAFRRVKVA